MSIPTTPCHALKDFHYSVDGIRISKAKVADVIDLPTAIYPGMLEAGLVKPLDTGITAADAEEFETKSIGPAEENKAHGAAEENKAITSRDRFEGMERQDLVAFLNERGVTFFKGSDDQKLRDLARLAAGSFHITKA